MTTYRLRNIDCPACAAGLEQGLRRVEGVRDVSIDFGTLSMRIDAADLAAVEAAVLRLEPLVSLTRIGAEAPGARP
ncbi:MAG TPA: heavy-metal-associated domain-containing protein, partial [Rectinemataceae bacterium]|nr:heavy-metal-associated domain-containing protein [Rectinemataceae bacterium]